MNPYPEMVAKIIDDYFMRIRSHLRGVPAPEQDDFLREIQSHVYEAYQQSPGGDEVGKILSVLRNFGEPAEVVAGRLPVNMVRSGARRKLPLQIVAGILIALFGIPLGFGGVAVLVGVLITLAGILMAYYAVAGSAFLAGAMFTLLGLIRIYQHEFWDRMVWLGYIRMDGPVADFLDHLSSATQGLLMLVFAAAFVASGLGMLRLGRRLVRGLHFLVSLAFDGLRRVSQKARRWFQAGPLAAEHDGKARPAVGRAGHFHVPPVMFNDLVDD